MNLDSSEQQKEYSVSVQQQTAWQNCRAIHEVHEDLFSIQQDFGGHCPVQQSWVSSICANSCEQLLLLLLTLMLAF